VAKVKTCLISSVESQWLSKLDGAVPLLATLLDPRMVKLAFVSDAERTALQRKFKVFMTSYVQRQKSRERRTVEDDSGRSDCKPASRQVDEAFDSFVGLPPEPPESAVALATSVCIALDAECLSYFADAHLPASGEDPLKWWQKSGEVYPVLRSVARALLSCPATSVSCERVFSDAGNVVDDNSTSLSDEHVDMKVFVYHNRQVMDAAVRACAE
jgi:hypothetical protein